VATQEVEVGGSWFKASLDKVSMRPCLKNKLKKTKGLGAWLKWYLTCQVSKRSNIQFPISKEKKRKE
jgi:hypothetical protein